MSFKLCSLVRHYTTLVGDIFSCAGSHLMHLHLAERDPVPQDTRGAGQTVMISPIQLMRRRYCCAITSKHIYFAHIKLSLTVCCTAASLEAAVGEGGVGTEQQATQAHARQVVQVLRHLGGPRRRCGA